MNNKTKVALLLANSVLLMSVNGNANATALDFHVDGADYQEIIAKDHGHFALINALPTAKAETLQGISVTIDGSGEYQGGDIIPFNKIKSTGVTRLAENNYFRVSNLSTGQFVSLFGEISNVTLKNNKQVLDHFTGAARGMANIYYADAGTYEISNNTFEINNATIDGHAHAIALWNQAKNGAIHEVSNNTLILNNVVAGDGGEIRLIWYSSWDESNQLIMKDNSIYLNNAEVTDVYVYYDDGLQDSLHFVPRDASGNAIHVAGKTNAASLNNFDQLFLTFDEQNRDSGAAVLTLHADKSNRWDEEYEYNAPLDLKGKEVTINALTVNPGTYHLIAMNAGEETKNRIKMDEKTVFASSGLFTETKWESTIKQEAEGTVLDLAIGSSGDCRNQLMLDGAPITGCAKTSGNKNATTLADGVLASHALINQAVEFIADEGLRGAMTADRAEGKGTLFGVVNGGVNRYRSDSNLDLNSMHFLIGGTQTVAFEEDRLTAIGFFESGRGISKAAVDGGVGEGRDTYFGLGAAARYHWSSGVYADGAVHVGYQNTKFEGQYNAGSASYQRNGLYVGAHVAGGYLWQLDDALSVDLYARYSVVHTGSENVSLHDSEKNRMEINAITTHSVRTGVAVSKAFQPNMHGRVGLAYEHVFAGAAKTAVNSVALYEPSLAGNNGILDLGLSFTPDAQKGGFGLDLGLKGYAGARRGLSGSVQVRYDF